MAGDVTEFIEQQAESGEYEYAASSPQAIVSQSAGSGGGGPRPVDSPAQKIQDYRLIADTDPLVGEAIETLTDYVVGSGFNIQPANVPGTDQEQTAEDIAALKLLVETSRFETVLGEWVRHAFIDGTAFMEIVVENDHFRPQILPTEEMSIRTDEYGTIEEFIQSPSSGDEISFEPHEIAVLRFHRHPKDQFGRSLVERVQEQADMLRDMEIDTARFVATKAYPPIVWQVGTEERPWTQGQIDEWLEEVQSIEPDTMLAVGHDVDHDVAGATSTSSTAGAMRLEPTFEHLMTRIATGIGVPADLLNVDTLSGTSMQVMMPKFDRRVQRYRNIVRQAVRFQIFPSLEENQVAAEYDGLPPQFEFGEHSSEEERLEARTAINLVNNGLLTPQAAAQRLDIDPERELPDIWDQDNLVDVLLQLAGRGDSIQNPQGGRPTDTQGGAQSAGREATTRRNPQDDSSSPEDRPQQSATNE